MNAQSVTIRKRSVPFHSIPSMSLFIPFHLAVLCDYISTQNMHLPYQMPSLLGCRLLPPSAHCRFTSISTFIISNWIGLYKAIHPSVHQFQHMPMASPPPLPHPPVVKAHFKSLEMIKLHFRNCLSAIQILTHLTHRWRGRDSWHNQNHMTTTAMVLALSLALAAFECSFCDVYFLQQTCFTLCFLMAFTASPQRCARLRAS